MSLFQKHWNVLDIPEIVKAEWYNEIITAYSEPQRHYHTLEHINRMLFLHEMYHEFIQSPLIVFYSIVFHDVVYDPKSAANEKNSIFLFEKFAKAAALPVNIKEQVSIFIKSTEKHNPLESTNVKDLMLFLDFGLEVLSWPVSQYKLYSENIRKEYIHYSEKDYRVGRCAVLTSFSRKPYIYFTPEFRSAIPPQHFIVGKNSCEQIARKNLQIEMQALSDSGQNL